MSCTGGACDAGVCLQNPFDCIVPSPPVTAFPDDIYLGVGTPPTAKGGAVADGRYVPSRIDIYGMTPSGIDIYTFEFKKGFFVQAAQNAFRTEYPHVAYIPEVQFAGGVTASGNLLKFDFQRCDPTYDIDIPNLPYTASANGMVTILTLASGTTLVTSYVRQ